MAVKKTTKSKTKTTAAKGKTTAAKGKSTATKGKTTKTTAKPAAKRQAPVREINEETGFVVGTDQDKIATALLAGGESRAAVVASLEKKIDTTTRNGTPKQLTNMVSGVLNKMLAKGYVVESTFAVTPPTPASKRAASRRANAAAAKPAAKKAPAKKTAAKTTAKKTTAKKTTKKK